MIQKNIYLISGDNDFLIEERIKELKNILLTGENSQIDIEQINENNVDLEKVLIALNTPSMFTKKKLVYIKDFYLFKNKEKEPNADEKRIIIELKNILPNTFIIFSCLGRIDKRNSFMKELLNFVMYEEYNNFSVWDEEGIVSWVINNARKKGYKIDNETAVIIKNSVDSDLRSIDQEINKIITFIGNMKNTISKDDVSIILPNSNINLFRLMNAIRDWKNKEASYLIYRMLDEGEDPVRLLYYIISQLRFVLLLKASSNQPIEEISKNMGMFNMSRNTYYLKKCINNISKLEIEKLKLSFNIAQEADFFIKTGQMEPRTALESFTNKVFLEN